MECPAADVVARSLFICVTTLSRTGTRDMCVTNVWMRAGKKNSHLRTVAAVATNESSCGRWGNFEMLRRISMLAARMGPECVRLEGTNRKRRDIDNRGFNNNHQRF